MLTGIKIYAALGVAFAVLLGGWYYGHRQYAAGAASVQTQFDSFRAQAAAVAAAAEQHKSAVESTQRADINSIAANYEAQSHVQLPTIADPLAAGLASGTFRLRDSAPVCAAGGGVSEATARSRAADAAATQALADRTQAAIAAVRAGDDADARERQLDNQITALQAVLDAERKSAQ